ncbi:MAG: DMT family transporter [Gammaproteobacteria bacterium]
MNNFLALAVIAVIGGAAIAIQSQLMGLMDEGMGTRESVFITYGGGGILAAVVMLVLRGGNLKAWQEVPWYVFSAGALGLLIVGAISYTVPRMGLAKAFTIIVTTQFIVAVLLDQFGWLGAAVRPLEFTRFLGICVLILGIWLILR